MQQQSGSDDPLETGIVKSDVQQRRGNSRASKMRMLLLTLSDAVIKKFIFININT